MTELSYLQSLSQLIDVCFLFLSPFSFSFSFSSSSSFFPFPFPFLSFSNKSPNNIPQVYKVEFETFSADPNNELSHDTIMMIFSNVDSIRALSQSFSEDLTTQMKSWTSTQTIGEFFVKIVCFFFFGLFFFFVVGFNSFSFRLRL